MCHYFQNSFIEEHHINLRFFSQSSYYLKMTQILTKIRQLITARGWAIYVLPHTDEHQSQYLCQTDERVQFISGFSGSNAVIVISQTEALLWTDGRYFLQAEKELYPTWTMKKLLVGEKKWFEHIVAFYPKESKIGIDPRLLSAQAGIDRSKYFADNGLVLELSIENLAETVWQTRPNPPKPEIYIHEQWAGKSISEKVNWVRQNINKKEGDAAIFNDLSQIAWILNLRSSEIPCNPFFKSTLIVRKQGGSLYLPKGHPSLQSELIQKHLGNENIKLEEYEPVFGAKSLITKKNLNFYIYSAIQDKEPIEWDGIGLYRAVRTEKEIQGFTRSHVVDGVAMSKFWAWRSLQDEVDEYEAAEYINARRFEQQFNKGLSFETISCGGPNAAVIHYHPTETVHSVITKDMIHLVDSGGQYIDGTTDCTRTYHFGKPTQEEKDAFTRVLLGNLDVERLRWPVGILSGGDIDVLARRHLWGKGMDYQHGTGHGVGHFQGVHEGPVGISHSQSTKFKTGMVVTNEPGYYEPGKFGIRIENLLLVCEQDGFNWFKNLTLCPYDKNLIELELVTKNDIEFINVYHQRVWDTLSPRLEGDEVTLAWLKQATAAI